MHIEKQVNSVAIKQTQTPQKKLIDDSAKEHILITFEQYDEVMSCLEKERFTTNGWTPSHSDLYHYFLPMIEKQMTQTKCTDSKHVKKRTALSLHPALYLLLWLDGMAEDIPENKKKILREFLRDVITLVPQGISSQDEVNSND